MKNLAGAKSLSAYNVEIPGTRQRAVIFPPQVGRKLILLPPAPRLLKAGIRNYAIFRTFICSAGGGRSCCRLGASKKELAQLDGERLPLRGRDGPEPCSSGHDGRRAGGQGGPPCCSCAPMSGSSASGGGPGESLSAASPCICPARNASAPCRHRPAASGTISALQPCISCTG